MVLLKKHEDCIAQAAEIIRSGKLAVIPTDTIYGFSTVDTEEGALLIQKAKGRSPEKSFIRLISSPEEIKRYSTAEINPRLTGYWPGAVTIIVPVSGGGTMAFRCPGDIWLRKLIKEIGRPVFSTSVNISGSSPLVRAEDIERQFGDTADLIVVDDEATAGQNETGKLPSTLVDASVYPYRILRQGEVFIPDSCLSF